MDDQRPVDDSVSNRPASASTNQAPAPEARRSFRVDGPHVSFAADAQGTRPARRDSQVLLEATQMLQQLQDDLAEHERREAALATREFELQEQQRSLEQWADRLRAELEERRAELLASEESLNYRLSSLDERMREVDRQALQLASQQHDFEQARAANEAERLEEFASRELELTTIRQQLADEWTRLEVAKAELAEQQQQQAQFAADQLENERQQLWASLTEEWKQHRAEFDAQQADWKITQESEAREIAELKRRYDQALLGLETQLTNRRAAFEAELARQREEHEAALIAEKTAWEVSQRSQLVEQQKERVQLETRLRFQQEHLEKTRAELEQQQREFRHERQQARQQLEDDTQQLERRMDQLRLFQKALDERTQSLDRERDTLLKCREAWDSTFDADRELLAAEHRAWDYEKREQQLELQRRQDLLTTHSESLERKQSRMDRLRMELEDTHRTTLELRLAVEETWAQIADSLGSDEEARIRVDQSRQALVLYYQELHASMEAHREELLEQQARYDQQRLAFHDERQTLLQWLNERDENLRDEEARIREEAAAMTAREAEWRHQRDHWLAEKLEGEALIRKLLGELGERAELTGPVSSDTVATDTRSASLETDSSSGPHFSIDGRMASPPAPPHN